MLKIGLTGGIGSGKSAVSTIFSENKIPVYNSDQRAKWLMNNDSLLKEKIVNLFDSQAYQDDNLNRSYISSIVFNDSSKLIQLNKLVHPAVALDFEQWIHKNKNTSYVVKEAAILIESEAYKQMDVIILVVCDESKRKERVVQRDNSSLKEVEKRIAKQLSDENKMKFADYVINNEGNLEDLEENVMNVINKIKLNY
jgi:dephospho-CoA kinase